MLKYVPVMARPLVLQRNEHPVIWTPVYADVTDPKMTDYLWDQKERIFQRERVKLYRKDPNAWSHAVHDPRMPIRRFSMQEDKNQQPYRLMTSVSVPVYNRKLNAVSTAPQGNPHELMSFLTTSHRKLDAYVTSRSEEDSL